MEKLYIIAGEASGDLHGSNLIKALNQKNSALNIRAWGGDLMESQGATVVKHYKDLAFMGFVEVVKNLKTILGNLRFCKEDILKFNPDKLILIDYPGFNLRIAKWAKDQKIPVYYYVAPQIWAWHTSRVHNIAKNTDRILSILPFEKTFYGRYGVDIDYVGHPLIDAIDNFIPDAAFAKDYLRRKPIVALLPGSRKQEIKRILPEMISLIEKYKEFTWVIAGAPSKTVSFYRSLLPKDVSIDICIDKTYDLLSIADYALVSSGTATLETALFKVPQIVCYRGNWLSFQIAKRLVKVPFISLVNLIANKEVVKELIQKDLNESELTKQFELLRKNKDSILEEYENLITQLGSSGASKRAAEIIINN